ncbi:histidinol-phosphatase HisJ family protein [Sporosarcina pasteurii]|uniref:Histidinol-phosphatase n=1 Tax=Sporosarcina pasteurii TaxID=1474 RepID=A0A380C7B3_SPOPA|nr:histidinol-phosphatase HisJ family protein [Sporosarcina pasteurii]MDS9473030.1 histidinol-phosphatase HisJ family protein [Sporosarcina pasteurii]QBQ04539.1 histidinol-phosphatase HisJ family protein [Sporosarcina pasteurii]SUJ14195.1 Histidinol-phosphatase [Sporosarcina pasteurii]
MFDFHMHSDFSADCNVSMEEMVVGSINKGLKEICFTEHIDYEYPDDSIIFEFDLKEYADELTRLQEKYEGKICIQKGIEIGVQPHILHKYEKLVDDETFDFIICSMHTTDKKSLHYKEIFEGRTVEEAYQLYYDELLACIKNFKRFNVLGHVDLVKRYSDEPSSNLFHEELATIFKEIIPEGKGIELNTSGVRYGLSHAMPSDDVLKLYKQCGGEIITLGSDAHRVSELAFQFRESLELLQSIGFDYITTFEKQEPVFHSIKQLL